MAQNTGINLPAGFGGLMRYGEEYESKFNLTPTHVVGFIIFIILLRVGLGFLYT
jgi:preprotein translocase subunit Sec61beta